MREENEIEKNENESEDGVVEHSKVQAFALAVPSLFCLLISGPLFLV